MLLLVASSLGACAVGPDGPNVGFDPAQDTGVMTRDSGAGRDASHGWDHPADAETVPGNTDSGSTTRADGGELDADLSDGGADANIEGDTGMSEVRDSGLEADTGGTQPDGSTGGDSGSSDGGQAPVECSAIVRQGVQLCDMGVDYCGAVFTNGIGCSATCAAAGLACATSYENVENQCARDEARPTLPCDSGHQSDYCLCRRQ